MVEVEWVVSKCPDVDKVVTLCHVLSEIASVLVAYYTTTGVRSVGDIERDITHRCVTSLPEYMRPKLVHVDEIPLQMHSGKIDRLALEAIYRCNINRQSSMQLAKLNSAEKKVCPFNCLRQLVYLSGNNSVSFAV
jgi:acyl-CoA synthetase (AMP-forming)/AMP-acid ligase II